MPGAHDRALRPGTLPSGMRAIAQLLRSSVRDRVLVRV